MLLEGGEAEEAGVDGGAFEGGDGACDCLEIEFWDLGFEAFGGDAIDRAGAGIVAVAVATDAGVIPIGDVEGSVRAYDDVGGAEENLSVVGIGAAADEVGYPDPAILFRPLLIYLVCACVAAAPFALLQWEHFDRRDALALTARIAIALILAAALGTALQLAAELAWQGSEDRTSARKFVIAPVAAVMAGAVVATVIAEPWLGQGRALRRWAALCLTVAACAALAFVFVGYLAKHGDGWLANSGAVGIGHAPAVLLALLMGGLVVTALAVVAGRPEGVRRRIAWSALPAAGLGLFVGHAAGRLRIAAEAMLEADLWLLAMTHAAAAATVALTVLLTDMTYRRLALYLRGRC